MSTISCGDPVRLIAHIVNSYPKADMDEPTRIQTKFRFHDGLVVNVFTNGTVYFQGKASPIEDEIRNQVDIINRA